MHITAHYTVPHPRTQYKTLSPLHSIQSHHLLYHPILSCHISALPIPSHHLTCIVDVSLSQALQLIQQPSQVNYHSVAHHTVRLHIQYT
jgi:hypothetical protein